MTRRHRNRVPLLAVLLGALGCGGTRPTTLGPVNGDLPPCPGRPNCVHTDHPGPDGPAPFLLSQPLPSVWPQLRSIVESMPRTRVIEMDERYLHAEAKSFLFRFVDDLEIYAPTSDDRLVIRSASRVGNGDLGVNGRRVEHLRTLMTARGLLVSP